MILQPLETFPFLKRLWSIYTADADEIIDAVNQERFKLLKQTLDPRFDIVEMKYANQLEKGSTYNFDVENRPKLYKRVRKFQWIDPIHEIVDCRLNTFTSEIEIIHKPSESHARRDLACFAKITLMLKPLNSRLHMMYSRQLFKAGSPEDFLRAFAYFSNCLIEQSRNEDIRITQCVLARCYNLQEDTYNLFKITTKNIRGNPSAEICCELGSYYMKEKDYAEALYWFYSAANSTNAELDINYGGFIPNLQMSRCFLELGDLNEARNYHYVAASYKPKDQAVIANKELLDNKKGIHE